MFNFRNIYEGLFSSFRVNRDVQLVGKLRDEWIKTIMIIKRSWIFGFFVSLAIFIIIGVMFLNFSLTRIIFSGIFEMYPPIVGGSFIFLSIFLIYCVTLYLLEFRRIHKTYSDILSIEDAQNIIQQGDDVFARFFNHITIIYFLVLTIVIFNILFLIFIPTIPLLDIYSLLDIIFFCALMWLISRYRKSMVELEMTYNLIIPGRIYFINQKSIYTGTETLEPQKVKLMKSSYPNIIASLLNYGDIEVYPDGMLIELGKMNLQYIDDPINTSDKLNKLLQEESKKT